MNVVERTVPVPPPVSETRYDLLDLSEEEIAYIALCLANVHKPGPPHRLYRALTHVDTRKSGFKPSGRSYLELEKI